MSYVYRRSHGTWWMRYPDHNGKLCSESTRQKTRRGAQRVLEKKLHDLAAGLDVPKSSEALTVDAAAEMLVRQLDDRGIKTKPVKDVLKRIRRTFGNRTMVSLTAPLQEAYIHSRRKAGAAPATINLELVRIGQMFRMAVAHRLISPNAVPTVRALKVRNRRVADITREQLEAILAAMPEQWARNVTEMDAWLGWRIGEVLALEAKDINRETCTIRMPAEHVKTGDDRLLHYETFSRVREIVEDAWWSRDPACTRLFQRKGRRITKNTYWRRWRAAVRGAGLPATMLTHDFRRMAATNLADLGTPYDVIMRIVGWRDIKTLLRYLQSRPEQQEAAGRKLSEFMGKVVPIVTKSSHSH